MEQQEGRNLNRLMIASVVAVVLIAGALTVSYLHSQQQRSDIVLPGGITYLGPSNASSSNITSTPTPEKFTATAGGQWRTHNGLTYPYSFSYPTSLKLAVFPKDPNDSVAFDWNGIPIEQNILLNIEKVDSRLPELSNKPKSEYVKVWYKSFPGLKSLGKMEEFTTTTGLKGYKAWYVNTQGEMPNVDIFLEVPQEKNLLIHLANGRLEEDVFNRIVDSMEWRK
ncbi:hypothetical protein A3D77_00025 [Candidatus Gottesmanbacteria bacterium RIFCSPHIGHO2_02_FULL_39_11]|uniref:Uncharacterized protein n=1 Tax=Candidatus Gottesmanbacteria bacterium RIFCSPHIGHO2_02_FULL_39_11 TaxID=1798382 RepID=A0A1F5ZYG4_9BACT|nr:MAG: hypothetical protein A3D77_00025 [Candidatus Gottesmanbacteria bacterium RIFCSPHIGHO2_02_FULL_39_11]